MSLSLFLYSLGDPDIISAFPSENDNLLLFSEIWTGIFSFLGILSIFYFYTYIYHPKGKRFSMLPMLITALSAAIIYVPLAFFRLQIIAYAIFAAISVTFYIYMAGSLISANKDDHTFYYSSTILFSVLGLQLVNVLYYSGYIANVWWWSSAYLWVCVVAFILVYLHFILTVSYQAERLQKQSERLRTNALLNQFKPHFVSNALTTIKSSYHRDIKEGDEAVFLLSECMRDSVGMLDERIVSFERELVFIMHYVDFCNIGREKPFIMEFNVDFVDFSVPSLSLQPYIENAIKYSGIDEKEGGRIVISSLEEAENIIIKIEDNGFGFDTKKVKIGAGISNSMERFSLLMNAETEVNSGDHGTIVIIQIPKTNRGG